METKQMIMIVATQCQLGEEKEFNKWYDEIHMPLLLKFKGIRKATRYQVVNENEEFPKYLAIYEFESKEIYEACKKSPKLAATLSKPWKKGEPELRWRMECEHLRTWER